MVLKISCFGQQYYSDLMNENNFNEQELESQKQLISLEKKKTQIHKTKNNKTRSFTQRKLIENLNHEILDHHNSSFHTSQSEQFQGKKLALQYKQQFKIGTKKKHLNINNLENHQIFANLFSASKQSLKQHFQIITEFYKDSWKEYSQKEIKVNYMYVSQFTTLQYVETMPQNNCCQKLLKQILFILKTISIACQKIINYFWFQYLVLLIILFNTIDLAFNDPYSQYGLFKNLEYFFIVFYTCEMLLKIFGLGFVLNKGTYLRDPWNILDFVIVITSWISFFLKNISFSVSALRALRVLRPLNTITKIKALKKIIVALFSAFSLILDTILIMFFFILVFGIGGLQLFSGSLKKRCVQEATGSFNAQLLCNNECSEGFVCGKAIANPSISRNFDTIGWSIFNIFQVITMEGWFEIMYDVQVTVHFATVLFFMPIIIIGSFVIISLLLVIIKYKFTKAKSINKKVEKKLCLEEKYSIEDIKSIVKNYGLTLFDQISNLNKMRTFPDKCIDDVKVGSSIFALVKKYQKEKMSIKRKSNMEKEYKKSRLLQEIFEEQIVHNSPRKKIKKMVRTQPIQIKQYEEEYYPDTQNQLKVNFEGPIFYYQKQKKSDNILEMIDEKQENQEMDDQTKLCIRSNNRKDKKNQYEQMKSEWLNLEMLKYFEKGNKKYQKKKIKQLQIIKWKEEDYKNLENLENLKDDLIWNNYLKKLYEQEQINITTVRSSKKSKGIHNVFKSLSNIEKFDNIDSQLNNNIEILRLSNDLSNKKLKIRVFIDTHIENYTSLPIILIKKRLEEQKIQKILVEKENSKIKMVHYYLDPEMQEKMEIIDKEITLPIAKYYLKKQTKTKEVQSEQTLYVNIQENETNQNLKVENKNDQLAPNLKKRIKIQQEKNSVVKKDKKKELIEKYFNFENEKNIKLLPKENKEIKENKQNKKKKQIFFENNLDLYKHIIESDLKQDRTIRSEMSHLVISKEKLPPHFPYSLNMSSDTYIQYLPGMVGFLKTYRNILKKIVFSSYADNLLILIVIGNTVILSLPGLVIDPYGLYVMQLLNFIFTILFTVECALKLIAIDLKYFRYPMNVFDFLIVILSLYQLVLTNQNGLGSTVTAFRSIRVFRTFRVLRVTKVLRSMEYMRIIMRVVTRTFNQFIYILILLFLFIIIYTLLGMQLFGSNYIDPNNRQRFDNLLFSVASVFQLMTAQDWNTIFNVTITNINNIVFAIFFNISWIFIGHYVLLNLFISILLGGFQLNNKEQEDNKNGQESMLERKETQQTSLGTKSRIQKSQYIRSKVNMMISDQVSLQSVSGIRSSNFTNIKCDMSLYLFSKKNLFRRFCNKIINMKYFETVIQIAIVFSSIKLIYDTYIGNNQLELFISKIIDISVTIFFTIQSILKIINYGFIFDEKSYLRDQWNILDFFIVIISLIDISLEAKDLSAIRILRLLRTLRPLRFISTNLNMKIIVIALIQSTSGIINVGIVILMIWLMFAIFMMNLMRDNLYYCSSTLYYEYSIYQLTRENCNSNYIENAKWIIYDMNFENIGNSLLTLFIFGNRQGWPTYMYQWIDSSSTGPILNNNFLPYFLLCVLFIIVGSFFLINLFLGVIFINFREAQRRIRNKILSDSQSIWINLQKLIINSNPNMIIHVVPENLIQKIVTIFYQCFKVCTHFLFDPFIFIVIIINIICMMINMDDQSQGIRNVLTIINLVFTIIFVVEIIIKFIAFGICGFFSNGWNIFDLFVVVFSIVDILITFILNSQDTNFLRIGPQLARIIRMFRVTRLLRLIKNLKNLQKLIDTFVFSMPYLINALFLFFLGLFIFSILGCYLFKNIKPDSLGIIRQGETFEYFHTAMINLFIYSTGQNWYKVMFITIKQTSNWSVLYWIFYIIIIQYMLLQVFVLIVLEQFEQNYIVENNPMTKFSIMEQDYRKNFIRLSDKQHGQKISDKKIVQLLINLSYPLGYDIKKKNQDYENELQKAKTDPQQIQLRLYQQKMVIKKNACKDIGIMKIKSTKGYLFYHELFYEIAKAHFFNECALEASPEQLKLLLQANKTSQDQLIQYKKKLIHNYSQRNDKSVIPLIRQLFVQMSMKSWARYSNYKENFQESFIKQNSLEFSLESEIPYLNLVGISTNITNSSNRKDSLSNSLYSKYTGMEMPETQMYKMLDDNGYIQNAQISKQSSWNMVKLKMKHSDKIF